jgi:hypothetical protein
VGTGGSPSTGRSIANSGGAGFSAGSSRGVSNSTLTISVPLTVAGVGEIDPRDLQRPNFRAEKPIPWGLPASVTGLSDRGLLHRVDSPRSKVGTRPVLDDMCSRKECGKRVYAAEQVVAIGKK